MQIAYYKTTLSLEEIQEILLTIQDKELRTKLDKLAKKIEAGFVKPAYVTEVKSDLLTSLGGGEDKGDKGDTVEDPLIIKQKIYNIYIDKPESLSDKEIEVALDYKVNVLGYSLTEEEERDDSNSWEAEEKKMRELQERLNHERKQAL